jgi:5-methylcytosine-specific restriction endonuclease McrA
VPDRDVARIHELAMAAFVEQLRKRRQAASDRPRRVEGSEVSAPARVDASREAREEESNQAGVGASRGSAPARATVPNRGGGRHVPAAIRREVWRRDEGQCTFEDSGGRRCEERAGLEIHHEHAFALGGPTTLDNLRLLCRAHNALLAERDLGRAQVERMRNEGRDRAPAG